VMSQSVNPKNIQTDVVNIAAFRECLVLLFAAWPNTPQNPDCKSCTKMKTSGASYERGRTHRKAEGENVAKL
jgi:hypothetical protein